MKYLEPYKPKDCKVTSLQSWPEPGMDPGPPWSIAILAESDQAIPITIDHKNFDGL